MKLLMAANWKMHKTQAEASSYMKELSQHLSEMPGDREVVICVPYTAISACLASGFSIGGQNCYPAEQGAYTGEISAGMLADAGCSWVLTGHSERRTLFGEDDALVAEKTDFSLRAGLSVILCIGESLEERDNGQLEAVLARQLEAGLAKIPADMAAERIAVAYEPVWAIGTGRVAGAKEILEAHAFVRSVLLKRLPVQGAKIRILYGGSVKPENAREILALDNVNGVLVGGASLQAESFSRIVLA